MEPPKKNEGNAKIVVIDAPDALVGFLVDEVSEVVRIDAEAIEKAPEYIAKGIESQYVLGIAKHEERLITLIDPLKVLELDGAGDGGGKDA
jgi:purine-binding chemotaxis protein CheW